MKKQSNGFTLIELIIIVAIVLILGTSSYSFYSRFFLQNEVSNTTDQLSGQIRKAQIYAMSGRQNGNWGVHYTSPTLSLFQGNSYATRNPAFDEVIAINNNVTISGFTEIIFARKTGIPSSTPTITISGGNTEKTLTINTQGITSLAGGPVPTSAPTNTPTPTTPIPTATNTPVPTNTPTATPTSTPTNTPTPTTAPQIAFVGNVSSAGNNSTSGSFSLPAGRQAGDVAIFWWYTRTNTKTFTPPGTITQQKQTSASGFGRIYIGYRVLQAADTTFAWTSSSASNSTVIWGTSVFRNVNTTTPFETDSGVPATFTNTANPNPPAVTTTSANAVVLPLFGKNNDYTTITVPSGYTTAGSATSTLGSDASAGVAYFKKPTPGAEDPGAWSAAGASSDDGYVWTGVLKPQ